MRLTGRASELSYPMTVAGGRDLLSLSTVIGGCVRSPLRQFQRHSGLAVSDQLAVAVSAEAEFGGDFRANQVDPRCWLRGARRFAGACDVCRCRGATSGGVLSPRPVASS